MTVEAEIRRLFADEQLSTVGIAPALSARRARPEDGARTGGDSSATAAARRYQRWLEQGMHGSMSYLERHAAMKYEPEQLMAGCRSLIVAAYPYQSSQRGSGGGRVASYAVHHDYHKAFGNRLRRIARALGKRFPEERFRPFTDTAPLDERFYAQAAGIGFVGRNTLLINESMGSWFVLGEIMTTMRLIPTPAAPAARSECPPGCFACGRACPTKALVAPGRIDARRCISYLTIEHRSEIPVGLRAQIGDRIFGCDECQRACPLNDPDSLARSPGPAPAPGAPEIDLTAGIDLGEVMRIATDEEFSRRFAGTALRRTGRAALIRNACIVAANTKRTDLLPLIRQLSEDANPMVASTARWVYNGLHGDDSTVL